MLHENPQTRADPLSIAPVPAYRIVMLAKNGTIFFSQRLSAESDEQACKLAKAMVDGRAVELWDGLRFIEHFPPVD